MHGYSTSLGASISTRIYCKRTELSSFVNRFSHAGIAIIPCTIARVSACPDLLPASACARPHSMTSKKKKSKADIEKELGLTEENENNDSLWERFTVRVHRIGGLPRLTV